MSKIRLAVAALGVAGALAIVAADYAEARAGRGGSAGSRGSRTFNAPPATNTAPKQAAPVEKSITQPGKATNAQGASSRQPACRAQASRFGGMRGLLMGGLIAAGLASIFGVGALASVLGFLLQFALIAGIVLLIVAFVRSRNQPALARAQARGPGAPMARDAMMREAPKASSSVPYVGGAAAAAGAAALAIGQEDLNTFEKRLGEIQHAYSEEDLDKLGELTTPEMLSYFAQDLSDNAKQGVRNELSDVKLLQGDIAEAWQEGGSDYATVAMRYSLIDAIVNKVTGKVVSGDRARPSEVTEVWTFRRDGRNAREGWQLSAIQQA